MRHRLRGGLAILLVLGDAASAWPAGLAARRASSGLGAGAPIGAIAQPSTDLSAAALSPLSLDAGLAAPSLGAPAPAADGAATSAAVEGVLPALGPEAAVAPRPGIAAAEAAPTARAAAPVLPPESADAAPERAGAGARAQLGEASRRGLSSPAVLSAMYDGAEAPAPGATAAPTPAATGQDELKALLRMRRKVRRDGLKIVREHFSEPLADQAVHEDVRRVLARLLAAVGYPAAAASLFLGASVVPNAFTTITPSESRYLDQATSLAKSFRITNVFMALGVLRGAKTEARLAFILAHELNHSWKGHLKGFQQGSREMLGHLHEFEADAEALKLVAKAGYDPRDAAYALHDLDEEMNRLEKDYSWFKSDKGELSDVMLYLRDVHPHPDLRYAYLMDHMDEALELYQPRPEDPAAPPVWKARSGAGLAPTKLDLFERELKADASQGDVAEGLRRLEARFQARIAERGEAKQDPVDEEFAAAEEGYKLLIARASTLRDLHRIEVSLSRNRVTDNDGDTEWTVFPTRRLRASLLTRQLDIVWGKIGTDATLEGFAREAGKLTPDGRRAGTLRMLGAIRTRGQLDAAYRALSDGAEGLGLDLSNLDEGVDSEVVEQQVASRLWKAARRVLAAELGRAPRADEIVEELRASRHLSAAWLARYLLGFQVEIVDSAFGPAEGRASATPSELMARLRGISRDKGARNPWAASKYVGLEYWGDRRYSEFKMYHRGKKLLHRHERYYLDGLSSPSPADALDLARRFWSSRSRALPSPFIRLLKRDGRVAGFLRDVLADLDATAKRRLGEAATAEDRYKALNDYIGRVSSLLQSALQDETDFGEIVRLCEEAWTQVSALMAAPEISAAFTKENRSQLSAGFLGAMADSLRWATVVANRSGRRPPAGDLARAGALAGRVEAGLGLEPGRSRVLAHAASLHVNMGSARSYMTAYSMALPATVQWPRAARLLARASDWRVEGGWWRVLVAWILEKTAALLRAPAYFRERRGRRAAARAGLGERSLEPLKEWDIIHLLALAGDESVRSADKIAAAALLDKTDAYQASAMFDQFGRPLGMTAAVTAGRWLLEDVSKETSDRDLPELTGMLLRLHDYHPGLLNPDMSENGTLGNAFRAGSAYVLRNEPLRVAAKHEHPFRGIGNRWALRWLERLDAARAWPKGAAERLDLLDLLNSTGEFTDAIDKRILSEAEADPEAFRAWAARDASRARGREGGSKGLGQVLARQLLSQVQEYVHVPKARPLRIVRNPVLRARLFALTIGKEIAEKARVSLWAKLTGALRLWRAWRKARVYFSAAFLKGLHGEGIVEDKIFAALEESDRVAQERTDAARARWDAGEFSAEDVHALQSPDMSDPPRAWKTLLPHKKEKALRAYKSLQKAKALQVLEELYKAYAGTREPLLDRILEEYPEPTRSRDALIEAVAKARRLDAGTIAFLDSHKSHRTPNPLRRMEKNLLDQATLQLRKFTAAERVDILLHLSGAKPLTRERLREFDRRVLSGGRRKLVASQAGVRGISQLEGYLSLLHPKDKELLVRGQFAGDLSLNASPDEVERLYIGLVIEGRGLPPFLERVLRGFFRVLNGDERARLISELVGREGETGRRLTGPEVLRLALKSMRVTGAKIAQVLATHRGLVPEEYARALEGFKDKAQDMDKSRALDLAADRLDAFVRTEEPLEKGQDVAGAAEEALPGLAPEKRAEIVEQVRFLLRRQGRRARFIEEVGPELGTGSIKVVYKIWLDDGRVWVLKLRAPGAAYRIRREFQILEYLVADLEADASLDPTQAAQARQVLDEVQGLIRSELDMSEEARIENEAIARAESRPWYAWLLIGRPPALPRPHPVFVGEDLIIEEFMPSTRFAELPERAAVGPSKASIARRTVREGLFDLVFHEWLEPDAHTGNRNARRAGWLDLLRTRLLMFDLGQGQAAPVDLLKPFIKAAFALDGGDARAAADLLLEAVQAPAGREIEVRDAMAVALARPGAAMNRAIDALVEAERHGGIIRARYAALQKAFMIYAGYGTWLPKGYLDAAFERAVLVRLWRDYPGSRWSLLHLGIKRVFLGRASVRAELERLVDGLQPRAQLPQQQP